MTRAADQLEHADFELPAEEENRRAVARAAEWEKLCRAAAAGKPSEAYRPPRAVFTRQGDRHIISARRSQWCQALLRLQGERYRLNRWHKTEFEDEAKRAWELREIDPQESLRIVERLEQFGQAERREYIYPVLDSRLNKALLMCARQVEKCVSKHSALLDSSGRPVLMRDIRVGDTVIGLGPDEAHTEAGVVTWKSKELLKPCVRVRTRQGHEAVVALTHPMRGWGSWVNAGGLPVGSRIGAVRRAGEFTGDEARPDWELKLLAYMIAEGYTPDHSCSFTQREDGPVLREFIDTVVDELGDEVSPSERRPGLWVLRFGARSELQRLVREWGLEDTLSAEKFVPDFVYGLDRRQTALFLNRLWAGDGHCSMQSSTKYSIEYDSISERLARDVQRLLWKFGVPTSFRRWKPSLYEGTGKWSYKIRVETAEGVRTFISEIGALGKTEGMPLPDPESENNNRDTYPIEIQADISEIVEGRRRATGKKQPRPSLRSSGLRETLEHAPGRGRLQKYVDHFRSVHEYPQDLVEALASHLDTDLFWDEIVEIEDLGAMPCYDITVAGIRSFVADGFITHNSTLCSAITVTESAMHSFFRTLYVSPSSQQTRTFSNEKLAPLLQYSPMIKKYWRDGSCRDQVFEQSFINGSFTFLRYAFLTADRARGIPADRLLIDEIQDILSENIRIIEECLSHSKYGWSLYAGTPKTLENTIQKYWEYSTQNEWMVPCDRCVPVGGGKRYWNNLDGDNIGDVGVICKNCGRLLNVDAGMWIAHNPGGAYNGFRISQLMVPWKLNDPDKWRDEIIWKLENYEEGEFNNEVIGRSFDNASKPIKRAELIACCHPANELHSYPLTDWVYDASSDQVRRGTVFMGVDWGEGRGGKGPDGRMRRPSYTVVTIGVSHGSKLGIIYQKRYEGHQADKDYVLMDVCRLIRKYGVQRVAVDAGHGWGINSDLFREFGDDLVVQIRYVSQLREYAKWDPVAFVVLIDRTYAMSETLQAMKRQELAFPPWEIAKEFLCDAEHLYADYRDKRKNEMYYDHTEPDDAFQSIVYCRLAMLLHFNQLIPHMY